MSRRTAFGTGSLGTDATAFTDNSCTGVERGMLLALAGTDACIKILHRNEMPLRYPCTNCERASLAACPQNVWGRG